MDGLTLLQCARACGLSVKAEEDRLIVRGPTSAAAVARALLARKPEVLAALTDAARVGRPIDWPEAARQRFIALLGEAQAGHMDTSPGSAAWSAAVREARRVAAQLPPGAATDAPTFLDDALAAFAPLGGLTVDRFTTPEALGLRPIPPAARSRACRWCHRSRWWSVDPNAELLTCGVCHPPVPALGRVHWRGEDLPVSPVTEDRP